MQNAGTIEDARIAGAFMNAKREIFFRGNPEHAYIDSAFPIGHGQTISQPSTIAVMLELLGVGEGMKVLEVGSGCGYVLALLSELAGEKGKVFGLEIVPELVNGSIGNLKKAGIGTNGSIENLKKAGIGNVSVRYGDGVNGMEGEAPFDRILVSAAAEEVPGALAEQLAPGGRLVMPVGPRHTQRMVLIQKDGEGNIEESYPYPGYFVFVPLRLK